MSRKTRGRVSEPGFIHKVKELWKNFCIFPFFLNVYTYIRT